MVFDFPTPDSGNIGGVHTFQFAPVDDIDMIYPSIGGRINRRVKFKSGKGWNQGYHRIFSCTFECAPKGSSVYDMKLRGFYPGSTSGAVDLFHRMSKYRYVITYTDYKGNTYLAGSLTNAFKFKADYTTTPSPDGGRGYAFEFSCVSKQPAVVYRILEPTELGGCRLWLDAADAAYNDDNKVLYWPDKSESRNTFFQENNSLRPSVHADGSVHFQANNATMMAEGYNLSNLSGLTIITVACITGTNEIYSAPFLIKGGAFDDAKVEFCFTYVPTFSGRLRMVTNTPTDGFSDRRSADAYPLITGQGYRLLTARWQSNTLPVFSNDNASSNSDTGYGMGWNDVASTGSYGEKLHIGAVPGLVANLEHRVKTTIAFSRYLSDTELQRITEMLNDQYELY